VTRPKNVQVLLDVEAAPAAPAALLEKAVRHTLAAEGCPRAEISVALLDDARMRELNRTWLKRDRSTDVIAFSLGEDGDVVGDVYVGFEQAVRQAAEAAIALDEELVRLVVHGTLHVLGHDHPEGEGRETSAMFRLQERLVREAMGATTAE
jgi:probable rRNA maturation factor